MGLGLFSESQSWWNLFHKAGHVQTLSMLNLKWISQDFRWAVYYLEIDIIIDLQTTFLIASCSHLCEYCNFPLGFSNVIGSIDCTYIPIETPWIFFFPLCFGKMLLKWVTTKPVTFQLPVWTMFLYLYTWSRTVVFSFFLFYLQYFT